MGYLKTKFIDATNFKHASAIGDGSTTNYVLSSTPVSLLEMRVCLNGIVQRPTTDYTLSGTTLTFTSAPALAETIDVFYLEKA